MCVYIYACIYVLSNGNHTTVVIHCIDLFHNDVTVSRDLLWLAKETARSLFKIRTAKSEYNAGQLLCRRLRQSLL